MEVQESQQKANSSWISKHHMLLMILCCLIPITAIVILRLVGIQSSFLSFAVVLICPVSMVMMMLFMHKKSDGNGSHVH